MIAQMQQQRMLQQRQALLQQQMYAGIPMNMQGMNMGNMTAAHLSAIRNSANMQRVGGNMPHLQQAHLAQQGQHQNSQHAQHILAQQLAMQQAQAQHQANNQMHQGNQPGHPGQMNPQQIQIQQAQMAQSMAQQVSQGQGPQPQPQPQGQPQQQGQPQPPQQPGQQQPGPQPGQQPQPNSQGPQRAPTPAVAQPPQPQNPVSNPAQGNQPQQPQGQGQVPNGQQSQPQQHTPQALQAVHMQLPNSIQQQLLHHQHKNDSMKGHCLIKLFQFGEQLSSYRISEEVPRPKDDLTYWNNFVSQFFSPKGVFRISLFYVGSDTGNEEHTDKLYEITQPALARYFHTHYESGIKKINLTFEKGLTDRPLPNGGHFIENTKAHLTYWFEHSHVIASGTLRAQFDSEQKLDVLEFITKSHEEYHSRKMVTEAARPAHNWVKEWLKVNGQDSRLSPEMSKKGKAKTMKSPPHPPPDIDLPPSAVKQNIGLTEAVFQFLEIIEVVGQMNPLFNFYHSHPGLSPYAALEQYVNQNITNGPQQPLVNGQPQSNGLPNPRTPNFGQFPMGASPAAAHLQLPNSPHMGSPAQGHMQAPGMQLQQSQQGTSSSGPSSNTSPASNKRRRPSTVKVEEENGAPTPASMGVPQVNGVAMANKKPPGTPRLQKRAKGNPA
ncbi:LIM-domain binding protein-domain-containing protein [Daldinia caldariorum]|uniref:LIM-domain binding protein-domain-containing protein n=1 Tax=Daldinia caldariorum TaxID=326644 RepID=UPI0020084031|nr:LIM-domain binding protein-domain-containing protein [Daldinia caldariorum]KAI1471850.1 LIM-domain binding protein-domain-containing protein [Daldinia caldariorum]